jgi:hypothetical protein
MKRISTWYVNMMSLVNFGEDFESWRECVWSQGMGCLVDGDVCCLVVVNTHK